MVQATGWDAVYQTHITHGWLPYAVWAMLGVGLVALAAAQIAAVSPFRQRSEPAFFSALCSCMQLTGKNGASASRLYAHTRPMRNTVAI